VRKLDAEDRWAIVETLSLHGHLSTGASCWTGLRRSSPRRLFTTSGDAGVRTLDGWRISHRVMRLQRTPVNGAYIAGEAEGQS
jgi:hypothetical protein